METARDVWVWFQVAFATIGGALGWYFGKIDGMFYALIVFCVIDWIVGAVRYGLDKELSSSLSFRKALEKLLIFVLVGIANVVDREIIGDGQVLRNAVVFFYLSSEGISILEHAGHIGLPIPKKLQAVLKELQKTDSEPDGPELPLEDADEKDGGEG